MGRPLLWSLAKGSWIPYGDDAVEIGSVIAGRYVIEALAGTGGMASVYRARDQQGGRLVAVKVLEQRTADLERQFLAESRLLYQLRHPAIVGYFDSGVTPSNRHFLVMEWLDGDDLATRLHRGPLAPVAALALLDRIASALALAHDHGIVHRDVKPANIFLLGGEPTAAKLLDFGIAQRDAARRTQTRPGARFGTPSYMSPEQVRGKQTRDPRTDTFSLGCVFFECLTGEPAFAAHDVMAVFCKILLDEPPRVRALNPALSVAVPDGPDGSDGLVARMLAKEPGDRPTMKDVVQEARMLAASLPDSAQPDAWEGRPDRQLSITDAEQRVVHVVAALDPRDLRQPDAFVAGALTESSGRAAETLAQLDRVTRQMEALGARCNPLGNGSVVAVLDNRGTGALGAGSSARDQAANAARCALLLNRLLPRAGVALAASRAVIESQRMVGSVIDRAIELLRPSGPASRDILAGPVKIDGFSAALLGARFPISGDERDGFFLHGEQHGLAGTRASPTATPFVGRERDLQKLMRVLDDSVEDEIAQAVLVTGAPGFGKSRLCREFLDRVQQRGDDVAVWLAQADPMRASSPLHIIGDAVRSITGIIASQLPALARYRLRDEVASLMPSAEIERITAFLGELINLPAGLSAHGNVIPQLAAARHDPKLMGDQIRRAFLDLLAAASEERPVLLIIEDLHWADRASIQLLDRGLRALAERPFVIIALARPDVRDSFPNLWIEHGVTEFRLGRLPRKSAVELVRTVMGPDIDDDRIAAIVERANGNAFYLEELVRSAAAGHRALPETIAAMIQARLDDLDPQARQVLRAASVFGDAFWHGSVAALLSQKVDIEEWLENLIASDIIIRSPNSRFADQQQYGFRHAIIRETVYEMLTEEDRKLAHRLAGGWLAGVGEPHSDVVADHFERGEAPDSAVPFYVRAAEDALNRSDLDTALSLAGRGVRCGADGTLLGYLYRIELLVEIWRGNLASVVDKGQKALGLLPEGSRAWYDVAGETAMAWSKLGDHGRADEIAETLLQRTGRDDDRIGGLLAVARIAQGFFISGRGSRAGQLLVAVETEIDDLATCDPVLAANVHLGRALRADTVLGDTGATLQALEQCASCFETAGDVREECLHRGNVGYGLMELGLYREAEDTLRAALARAEKLEIDFAANGIRRQLALVLAYRGSLDEATSLGRRARDWFATREDIRSIVLCHVFLSSILLMSHELDSAEHETARALDHLAGVAPLRAYALALHADILLSREQPDRALRAAEESMKILDAVGSVESGELIIRLVHARALRAAGKSDEAQRSIARSRELVLARAEKIRDPAWRCSFLENVPEVAQIMRFSES